MERCTDDRAKLYRRVIVISPGFLGFLVTAIAFPSGLASRRIVQELHRREAFSPLITSIRAGRCAPHGRHLAWNRCSVFDDRAAGRGWSESIWQAVVLASTIVLVQWVFYFALATYKMATSEWRHTGARQERRDYLIELGSTTSAMRMFKNSKNRLMRCSACAGSYRSRTARCG